MILYSASTCSTVYFFFFARLLQKYPLLLNRDDFGTLLRLIVVDMLVAAIRFGAVGMPRPGCWHIVSSSVSVDTQPLASVPPTKAACLQEASRWRVEAERRVFIVKSLRKTETLVLCRCHARQ